MISRTLERVSAVVILLAMVLVLFLQGLRHTQRDADAQASFRVLSQFHLKYLGDVGVQESDYLAEIERLRAEYPHMIGLRHYHTNLRESSNAVIERRQGGQYRPGASQ